MKFTMTADSKPFKGIIPGYLCGWSFEGIRERDGYKGFMSCTFVPCTAEEAASYDDYDRFIADCGITLTGNVRFHGYFTQYYDHEVADWCVREEEV